TNLNAGSSTTYAIVVTNPATVAVSGVSVSDTFPGTLSGCTWTCSASAGGTCQSASGSGNIAATTNAIAGNNGTLSFSATCTSSSAATGSLVNTASTSYVNDTNAANNSATDTDAFVPGADLSITNSNGGATIIQGANTTYAIVVTNPATVAVSNVSVADTFPAALSGCAWTCSASSGGTCQAPSGSGNIATTTNTLAGSGGTLSFSATCTLSAAATGSLVDTATVSYANETNAANNSATDTDTITPAADLSLTNSDGVTSINAGATVNYTIQATNPPGNNVSSVSVADTFPPSLSGCTWTCAASNGGACEAPSGSGNIATSANSINKNGTLTYSASCTLSNSATGTLVNVAAIGYAGDGNTANNSATDTDTIVARSDLALTN